MTELNHDDKVDDQISFSSKGKSIKSKNYKIIQAMILEDIENTDLHSFCLDVKDILEDL